jgi:hypothetical protein
MAAELEASDPRRGGRDLEHLRCLDRPATWLAASAGKRCHEAGGDPARRIASETSRSRLVRDRCEAPGGRGAGSKRAFRAGVAGGGRACRTAPALTPRCDPSPNRASSALRHRRDRTRTRPGRPQASGGPSQPTRSSSSTPARRRRRSAGCSRWSGARPGVRALEVEKARRPPLRDPRGSSRLAPLLRACPRRAGRDRPRQPRILPGAARAGGARRGASPALRHPRRSHRIDGPSGRGWTTPSLCCLRAGLGSPALAPAGNGDHPARPGSPGGNLLCAPGAPCRSRHSDAPHGPGPPARRPRAPRRGISSRGAGAHPTRARAREAIRRTCVVLFTDLDHHWGRPLRGGGRWSRRVQT